MHICCMDPAPVGTGNFLNWSAGDRRSFGRARVSSAISIARANGAYGGNGTLCDTVSSVHWRPDMIKLAAILAAALALLVNAAALDYKPVGDWLKLPPGRPALGNMHGDIAVSSKGEVYVSVQDPQAGLQVFAPDGAFLRNVPNAPS